jgi:putative transcription factor
MCGKESELILVELEGTRLNVCENCAKYGKRIKIMPKARQIIPQKKVEVEDKRRVKDGIGEMIKSKRESLGLKQMELAKMLAEKESIIHKIESGTYRPSIDLARKMEKQLGLKLIEEVVEGDVEIKTEKGVLTIGDMLKVK